MLFRFCIVWTLAGVVAAEESFRTVAAPVGPANPRNSEAAIIPLQDGSLLLRILPATRSSPAPESPLRLDQTQVIGTHNSYHVAPDVVADSLMRAVVPREETPYGLGGTRQMTPSFWA